jgi:DNA-binding beta-propeller fold protein YncE
VAGSPFASGGAPYSVRVSPSGRYAYTANYCTNDISMFRINPTNGKLTPTAASPVAAGNGPLFVNFDESGRLAYVDNAFDNTISA